MKATEAKEIAFKSIAKEKEKFIALIKKQATEGQLSVQIDSISDACKKSLEEDGYSIKIYIDPSHKEGDDFPLSINWSGK